MQNNSTPGEALSPELIMIIITLIINILQVVSDVLMHIRKINSTCCGGTLAISSEPSASDLRDRITNNNNNNNAGANNEQ